MPIVKRNPTTIKIPINNSGDSKLKIELDSTANPKIPATIKMIKRLKTLGFFRLGSSFVRIKRSEKISKKSENPISSN